MAGNVELTMKQVVVDFLKPSSSAWQLHQTMEAFGKVCESMYPLWAIHNIEFCDLMEENKLFHDESLVQNVDYF